FDHGCERGDGSHGGHGRREQHHAHQCRNIYDRLLEFHGYGELQQHRRHDDHRQHRQGECDGGGHAVHEPRHDLHRSAAHGGGHFDHGCERGDGSDGGRGGREPHDAHPCWHVRDRLLVLHRHRQLQRHRQHDDHRQHCQGECGGRSDTLYQCPL